MQNRHWSVLLVMMLTAGCAETVPAASTCRNLVYKEYGLSRAEYLPCAGEMMSALDDVAAQSAAAFDGDQQARTKGQASLRRLQALMAVAGGRNLLERWRDERLSSLNWDISNAATKYEAFYMVRILEEPNQFAAQSRSAAESELRGGMRRYSEARTTYQRLR